MTLASSTLWSAQDKMKQNSKVEDKEKIQQVMGLYEQLDVLQDANELKNKYYELALSNLSNLELSNDKKDKLKSFAEFLMNRNY